MKITSQTLSTRSNLFRMTALALLGMTASAQAAEGPYDGAYDLRYEHLEMTLQCGEVVNGQIQVLVSDTVSADVSSTMALPTDTFANAEAALAADIQAQNLTERQEAAALKALELSLEGLERSLNRGLTALPETLDIQAQDAGNTQVSYTFMASMTDLSSSRTTQAPGTMSKLGGVFSLAPVYLIKQTDKARNLTTVSGGVQLGGSVVEGMGDLRWNVQAMMSQPTLTTVYGCTVSSDVTFNIDGYESTMAKPSRP